ncbi:hypothetical protein BH11ACT2_BH11ACT2_23000 [soil metagenome]
MSTYPDTPLPESVEPVAQRSSALLIGYGIAGGVFVLYVIGWIIGIPRAKVILDGGLGQQGLSAIMETIGAGVAIASGPLWFACVFLVTRHSRPVVRLLWLALGIVLLIPWPLLAGGAA